MSPSTFYGISKDIIESYIFEKAKQELKYMICDQLMFMVGKLKMLIRIKALLKIQFFL